MTSQGTSPYECKILEWDDKLQINKQTKNITGVGVGGGV